MEISILAVNRRTFRFNRPQPRAQTVLLARHAIILPNEGQERVTNPWKAQGRPKEGPSLCMTQLGSGNDFACRAQGSAGNYKRCRRLPSADVHFVNFILEDCYTSALVKKNSRQDVFQNTFFRPTSRLTKQFATQKQHEFKRTLTYPACQNSR